MPDLAVAVALLLLAQACTASGSPQPSRSAPPTSSTATATEATETSTTIGAFPTALLTPLQIPVLEPGQACPATPGKPVNTPTFGGIALGDGLVRPIVAAEGDLLDGTAELLTETRFPPWLALKTLWISDPSYRGPFIIRARQLDGAGPIGVGGSPTDTMIVGPTIDGGPDGNQAPSGTWVRAPGCYGWQVDGLTFTEVVVVNAVLP